MAKTDPEKSLFELQLIFSLDEYGEFTLLDDETTNSLLETNIQSWYTDSTLTPTFEECKEIVRKLKPVLMGEFHRKKSSIETELRNVHISRQNRVIDTEIDFLKRQIEKDTQTLQQDPENAIKFIYNKRINEYENKIHLLTAQKANIKLDLHESLQSISIIAIT